MLIATLIIQFLLPKAFCLLVIVEISFANNYEVRISTSKPQFFNQIIEREWHLNNNNRLPSVYDGERVQVTLYSLSYPCSNWCSVNKEIGVFRTPFKQGYSSTQGFLPNYTKLQTRDWTDFNSNHSLNEYSTRCQHAAMIRNSAQWYFLCRID